MRILPRALGAALMLAAALASPASADPQRSATAIGTWLNPRGSVAVETRMCGEALCGRVVWASPEALKDAADAGISALIGTELLQDYTPTRSGVWHGRVYVPDMGRTFQSTIVAERGDALRISGCILGGLICKTQLWRHV